MSFEVYTKRIAMVLCCIALHYIALHYVASRYSIHNAIFMSTKMNPVSVVTLPSNCIKEDEVILQLSIVLGQHNRVSADHLHIRSVDTSRIPACVVIKYLLLFGRSS